MEKITKWILGLLIMGLAIIFTTSFVYGQIPEVPNFYYQYLGEKMVEKLTIWS